MSKKIKQGIVIQSEEAQNCYLFFELEKMPELTTVASFPGTLTWIEPSDDSEYCHCRCHTIPMLHCQPCCEGKCWKCDKPIKKDRDKHMAVCQDFSNPQKLYDDLAAARKEINKLKGENNFLNDVYKALKEGSPVKPRKLQLHVINWADSGQAIRDVGLVPGTTQDVSIDQILTLIERGNSVGFRDREIAGVLTKCLCVDSPGNFFGQR